MTSLWFSPRSYGPKTENAFSIETKQFRALTKNWGRPSFWINRQTEKRNPILLVNHKMGLAKALTVRICEWAAWFRQQWGQKHQTREDSTQWKPKASGYTSLRCSSSFLCASFTSHNTASTKRSVMGYWESRGAPALTFDFSDYR